MKLKNKIAALSTLLIFQTFGAVNAAEVDREIAVFAAEQDRTDEEVEVFSRESLNGDKDKPKTKDEVKAEEKRIEKEREEARKKIKEERKKSRDELNGKTPISKNPAPISRNSQSNSNYTPQKNISAAKENPAVIENSAVKDEPVEKKNSPAENFNTVREIQVVEEVQPVENVQNEVTNQNFGVANPMVNRASFNEVVQAVNFTPLYLPHKSGYTITSMFTIDNQIAEIRYSRKWEPNTSLHVRTYHRADGEELNDISGVHGVKWRVNVTNGITTYIAKIDETKHVAAWAVGNYTFSAYVENLSLAAFMSIVSDELVDLSQHYYLN